VKNWEQNFSSTYITSVDGKVRITRMCGYVKSNRTSNEDSKSCFKDAFTSHTSSWYCDCFDDGCNSAYKVHSNVFLTMGTTLVAMKRFFNWKTQKQIDQLRTQSILVSENNENELSFNEVLWFILSSIRSLFVTFK
jgi:hypothetical protein